MSMRGSPRKTMETHARGTAARNMRLQGKNAGDSKASTGLGREPRREESECAPTGVFSMA
jgi:hypothetical protein